MHTYQSDGVTVESSNNNPAIALAEIRAKCLNRGMKAPTGIMQISNTESPNRIAPSFGSHLEPFTDRKGAK